jgi:hypothetical protein
MSMFAKCTWKSFATFVKSDNFMRKIIASAKIEYYFNLVLLGA